MPGSGDDPRRQLLRPVAVSRSRQMAADVDSLLHEVRNGELGALR